MNNNTTYLVTNRSASTLVYTISDDHIRRVFQAGETKKIKHSEIEKLSYQPGGQKLINDYLLLQSKEAIEDLDIHTEPEYYLDGKQITDLITNGSLDAWLDCLDFAPQGVIDMIKSLSVSVPLNDSKKRQALKQKTGFDVDAALRHIAEEREEEGKPATTAAAPRRRVVEKEEKRRTAPKYNVVKEG